MNKMNFDHLLACYGTNLERWPEEHRDEGKSALASHPTWQNELNEQTGLDELLDELFDEDGLEHIALDIIEQNILAKTIHSPSNLARPAQNLNQNRSIENVLDRIIDWVLDWILPSGAIWKSAIAASLPVLIGATIGFMVDFDERFSLEDELALTGLQLDAWEIRDE